MHTTFRSPRFSINTNQDFARVLNERVSQYFSQKNKSKHANASMVFKTLFMLSLYLFPLVMLLWVSNPWISILLWFIAGIGMAGVGLSVMHDANHGAYSSNRFVNKTVGGVLNIIGGNPTNWKIQHNVLHHTFTNVDGFDEDIAPPIPILRFSPHSAWKPVHKYQHIYAWFFYPLMTIMWYLTKDYKQAIRYHKQGLTASQGLTLSQHLFNIIFVESSLYPSFYSISYLVGTRLMVCNSYWIYSNAMRCRIITLLNFSAGTCYSGHPISTPG